MTKKDVKTELENLRARIAELEDALASDSNWRFGGLFCTANERKDGSGIGVNARSHLGNQHLLWIASGKYRDRDAMTSEAQKFCDAIERLGQILTQSGD